MIRLTFGDLEKLKRCGLSRICYQILEEFGHPMNEIGPDWLLKMSASVCDPDPDTHGFLRPLLLNFDLVHCPGSTEPTVTNCGARVYVTQHTESPESPPITIEWAHQKTRTKIRTLVPTFAHAVLENLGLKPEAVPG